MMKSLVNSKDKYLSPKFDVVFKSLFGKNKSILRSFLNSVLDLNIEKDEDIEYQTNDQVINYFDQKASVMDLVVKTINKGEPCFVNVEIQLKNYSGLEKRFTYYSTSFVPSLLKKGDNYDELPKLICLNILDFDMFPEREDYISTAGITFLHADKFISNDILIHFIELPKYLKTIEESSCLKDLWLLLFKCKTEEEFEMLKGKEVIMEKVVSELNFLAQDDSLYREYIKQKLDYFTFKEDKKLTREEGFALGRKDGIEEGFALGKEDGRNEKAIEVATNLKMLNCDIQVIHRSTGLSIEEIEAL